MEIEGKGQPDEARRLFLQAWNDAADDFEKFMAAYFVAERQENLGDKVEWLETAIKFALIKNDEGVKAAFPPLYSDLARCYEELGDPDNAKKYSELAKSYADEPSDTGPFYHGTRADLDTGDLLTAGGTSN
jgi:rifampin ADP-ribosylating transferase